MAAAAEGGGTCRKGEEEDSHQAIVTVGPELASRVRRRASVGAPRPAGAIPRRAVGRRRRCRGRRRRGRGVRVRDRARGRSEFRGRQGRVAPTRHHDEERGREVLPRRRQGGIFRQLAARGLDGRIPREFRLRVSVFFPTRSDLPSVQASCPIDEFGVPRSLHHSIFGTPLLRFWSRRKRRWTNLIGGWRR